MSTADKTGRITQALGDRLACLGMDMNESVNARAAEFNDLLVTIDPLGAETPEMRAERKAAEREDMKAWRKGIFSALFTVLGFGLSVAVGMVFGAVNHEEVMDLIPPAVSPSGERAEPEESAR